MSTEYKQSNNARANSVPKEKQSKALKEARKGFSLHARAQSTHVITKMYASAK